MVLWFLKMHMAYPIPDKKIKALISWNHLRGLKDCMMKFASERVENTVEKGANAGYQHFLLFA